MKILIISDGTPTGTRVTDEYHKPIEGITEVSFSHKLNESPVISLKLNTAQVGVNADIIEISPTEKPSDENRITSEQTAARATRGRPAGNKPRTT